jgi:hypothetical protein
MKHAIRALLLAGMMALPLAPPPAVAQAAKAAAAVEAPKVYTLSAAYPNPFNPRTSFTLTVAETQPVRVEVFNLLGLPVKLLYNGTLEGGETKTFTFEAEDLPNGIYLYRVQGKSFTATRQMTLLK